MSWDRHGRIDTEDDLRILLGRLIERSDTTNGWMSFINRRLEAGAQEIADLRAADARLEGKLDLLLETRSLAAKTDEKPAGLLKSLIELIRSGKEFAEAVASLKEWVIGAAVMFLAGSAIAHPAAVKALIASYFASGP